MTYQSGIPRTPGLRLPAQSAPVDRTGAQTSASGDGPGVEAALFGINFSKVFHDVGDAVAKYGPGVAKVAGPLALALL
jgi:hypothetical protein